MILETGLYVLLMVLVFAVCILFVRINQLEKKQRRGNSHCHDSIHMARYEFKERLELLEEYLEVEYKDQSTNPAHYTEKED